MGTAAALLADLSSAGFVLSVEADGALACRPGSRLSDTQVDAIRQLEAALIDLLRAPSKEPDLQETAGQCAPNRSCPACELRLWWRCPDGGWVCAVCVPDPIKCRWCDRPHYSHLAWPMVCLRWETKA